MTVLEFLTVAAVLFFATALPLLLGYGIARALKLKDLGGRLALSLFMLFFFGLTPFAWKYYQYVRNHASFDSRLAAWEEGREAWVEWEKKSPAEKRKAIDNDEEPPEEVTELAKPETPEEQPLLWRSSLDQPPPVWQSAINLGIDLAGGTNLVYEVQDGALDKAIAESKGEQSRSGIMQNMVGAIGRRLNPSGTEEVTVRQVGDDRIEVIMPGADTETVERMKRRITRLGSLEFAILACQNNYEPHRKPIRDARALPDNQRNVMGDDGQPLASWLDVARNPKTGIQKPFDGHGGVVSRSVKIAGEDVLQVLVVFQPKEERVTGEFLKVARAERDSSTGQQAVTFTFNAEGGNRFNRLTTEYRPREGREPFRLAVLLDENVHSAPNLQAVITRTGQITGVEGDEVQELVNVLNAGALAVPIKRAPVSEATVGPTLADDVREKGIMAIAIAAGAVVVFMLLYYGFAGVVADICLLMNIVLVMGLMVFIQATFTLPGLAGIVLTVGMAVDANVLIFERIREETKKGSRLRMAIQNGFGKAFTTIVDANVTTLLTAVVLYMIGTDQVRGFAVTLFIGILTSMFTALYVGRLIFDVAEKKKWISELKMRSIVGDTHWDFLGKKSFAGIVSAVLIIGGMAALFSRGEDNLDIDFSGGIMVTFSLKDGTELETVQDALDAEFPSGVTLERLLTGNEEDGKAKKFRMRIKESDVEGADDEDVAIESLVGTRVASALSAENLPLWVVSLKEIGEITPIPNAAPEPPAGEEDDPAEDISIFAGGRSVELVFSEAVRKSAEGKPSLDNPITMAFVKESFVEQLENVDKNRFELAEQLVEFELVDPVEKTADDGTVLGQESKTAVLRVTPDVLDDDLEAALAGMQKSLPESPKFDEVNSFSSAVGGEMKWSAGRAMFISLIAIIGYIWFRFEQVTFGLAAVVALVHDVLVVLGLVAVAGLVHEPLGFLLLNDFRINLPMIAAFLTIVGYSLNDTIVVFDRIREVRGKNPALTEEMVNTSLNQTLARTLLTSVTTLIVVLILYVFGGEGIHGFAFCLVLGVLVGTYSSIYVASPVLLWLTNRPGPNSNPAPAVSEKAAAAG